MSADRVRSNLADDVPCPEGWDEAPLSSVADIRFSNVDKKTESG